MNIIEILIRWGYFEELPSIILDITAIIDGNFLRLYLVTRTSKSVKSTRCKVSPLSHYISLEITTSNATRKPISQNSYCEHNIYDIGTKIIFVQCFVITDMFSFCKPIIFSGNCRICRDLAFGSVKTRFKAILKKLDFSVQIDFSAQIYFFMNFCPRGATKLRSL